MLRSGKVNQPAERRLDGLKVGEHLTGALAACGVVATAAVIGAGVTAGPADGKQPIDELFMNGGDLLAQLLGHVD